jgi:predicted small lipoprotein YifL
MDDGANMKTCWAKYLLYLVMLVLGTTSMISACGKKGDLYHPEQTQDQQK